MAFARLPALQAVLGFVPEHPLLEQMAQKCQLMVPMGEAHSEWLRSAQNSRAFGSATA